jgi:hypothetical protein
MKTKTRVVNKLRNAGMEELELLSQLLSPRGELIVLEDLLEPLPT